MKIRVLQHEPWIDGGEYIAWAKRNNHELAYTKVYAYDEIPNDVDSDMLLICGGPQCPKTTKEEYPYYDNQKEKEFIKRYIDANKIVIGSCLGAQLIGEALGADYLHSPYTEVGMVVGKLTKEGKNDKHFTSFPNKLLIGEWHNDMPGLTKEAVVIMKSKGCPRQIIKFAPFVYGFQAHIEFTHNSFVKGLEAHDNSLKLVGPYICSKEEMLKIDTTEMNKCLSNFLDSLVKDYFS